MLANLVSSAIPLVRWRENEPGGYAWRKPSPLAGMDFPPGSHGYP